MNSADLWPIVKAHAEGKKIQFREDKTDNWEFTCDPCWDPECEYRIAPEPKVRPWTMDEVPVGKVVRINHNTIRMLIVSADCSGRIHVGGSGDYYITGAMLNECTMDDGSPCGVICE